MSSLRPISAAQLQMQASPAGKQYKRIEWHNHLQLYVRPILSMREMVDTVRGIIGSVVDHEKEIYRPEMLDFAIRVWTVMSYALVELPDDAEEQYYLLYTTDLYDTVKKYINSGQFDAILSAVKAELRYFS